MGSVGRKPIPLDERRQFVSVGLAPSIMAALKTFQRRSGISNVAEAARVLIIQGLERAEIYDPDPPPTPKRKAPR